MKLYLVFKYILHQYPPRKWELIVLALEGVSKHYDFYWHPMASSLNSDGKLGHH